MTDHDWSAPGIGSVQAAEGAAGEIALLSFGAIWLGALGVAVWMDAGALCMVVPFGFIGVLPLMLGLKVRRNRLRYGRARFEITTDGSPGGQLEGLVHIPHPIEPGTHIRATLICMRRVFGADSVDAVISRTVTFVEPSPSKGGAPGRIPIELDVPAGATPSDAGEGDGSIYWKLQLVAEKGCQGLDLLFHVPVAKN